MPIDGLVFTALVQELAGSLKNARIQGVFQPSPTDLVLQLRQPGKTYRLAISIDPSLARVHLTGEDPENPLAPPAFCALLRKHLVPGRVAGIRQPPLERVLELVVDGRGDAGERTRRHLYVEIMGRHSNVILTDDEGRILDAMKRVPGDVNRHRELLPARPYLPPPAQERVDPWTLDPEAFDRMVRLVPAGAKPAEVLAQNVAGFSPLAGREVVARAGLDPGVTREALAPGDVPKLYQAFREVVQALEPGRAEPCAVDAGERVEFWLLPLLTVEGACRRFPSVNQLVDWVYRRRAAGERFRREQKRLAAVVDQHLRRLDRKIQLQQQEVEAARRAEEYRTAGDLLMSYLHEVQPGASRVELPNFYDGGRPFAIELDPSETPAANAQRYYRKYQKAKKTLEKAAAQLEASRSERAYLESVKTALELSESPAELEEVEEELRREGYLPERTGPGQKPRAKAQAAASSPLTWTSSDGFRIVVGRNNRQNDLVTMQMARGDDLWLHAQGIPGAHVIVQTGGKDVPEQTLLEAAVLAALYSKARDSANVPVDYTFRRYVRKPRGAKPGMVIYDHQRTLFVTPDPHLPERLGARPPERPESSL